MLTFTHLSRPPLTACGGPSDAAAKAQASLKSSLAVPLHFLLSHVPRRFCFLTPWDIVSLDISSLLFCILTLFSLVLLCLCPFRPGLDGPAAPFRPCAYVVPLFTTAEQGGCVLMGWSAALQRSAECAPQAAQHPGWKKDLRHARVCKACCPVP